jgi:hypothetical protein
LNKTPKTEIIAIELAKGATDGDAYGKAFSCTKASANSQAGQYIAEHKLRQRAIDIVQQTAGLKLEDALNVVKDGLKSTYTDRYGVHSDSIARLEHAKVLLRLHNELKDTDTKTLNLTQMNTYNIVNDIGIDKLRELIAEVKHMRQHRDDISDGEIV